MIDFYLLGFKKTLSVLKKIIIVFFVYLAITAIFLQFINKDKEKITYNRIEKSRQQIYKFINDKQLNQTKEGKIGISLYRGLMCGLIGEACTDNPADGDKNFKNSLFGYISSLIALPYSYPPASGVYWVYSGLQNANFIPKTYAYEGIGLAAIMPLMSIWRVFRDVSYMLLVLVLIGIGFMIMFRTKINPQTVISVENSLPKIVIALILITFSFPIAGFLIDMMYVLIILVIQILSPQILQIKDIGINNQQELVAQYLNPTFGKIFPPNFFKNYWQIGNDMYAILPESIRLIITPILQLVSGILAVKIIQGGTGNNKGLVQAFTDVFSNVQGAFISWGKLPNLIGIILDIVFFILLALVGPPILLGLLVFFTLIFTIFRIFFLLLFNYISIILLIVLSPIILIFEAIPGKGTFSYWLKNLAANLLSFVFVVVLIFMSTLIGASYSNSQDVPWAPPFIFGINGESLAGVIGLGIFLLIPDLIKMLKEAMGAKGLPISLGLGTFFGGVGAAYGGATGALQQFSGLAMMPGLSGILGKIPGFDSIKGKLIPPQQLDIQKWATIQQLKAMQLTASEGDKEKIEAQIQKIEQSLPKDMRG